MMFWRVASSWWTLSRSHVAARLHLASLDLKAKIPIDVASIFPFVSYIVQQTFANRSIAITILLMVFLITNPRTCTDDHRF
jgi:low affinity Fe/Cu permease